MKAPLWYQKLVFEVDKSGQAAVARKTGLSKTTISQLVNKKYPASTDKVAAVILATYNYADDISCPILGSISPETCQKNAHNAQIIGMKCGNPATMRLYSACKNCK